MTSWPEGVPNAINNDSALILQPNQVIETDLAAVAFKGDYVTRVNVDGTVEEKLPV